MLIPGTACSDYDPFEKIRKELGSQLYDFVERASGITHADLKKNTLEVLFANAVEELGEYAAAKTVEKGIKKKKLKESSLVESVDLVICSLSLFFGNGGTLEDLCKIGQEKLNKYEERVKG